MCYFKTILIELQGFSSRTCLTRWRLEGCRAVLEMREDCEHRSNTQTKTEKRCTERTKRVPKLRTRAPAAHIIISTEDYAKQNACSHFTICTHRLILVYFIFFCQCYFFRLRPSLCLFRSKSHGSRKSTQRTMTKLLFILLAVVQII